MVVTRSQKSPSERIELLPDESPPRDTPPSTSASGTENHTSVTGTTATATTGTGTTATENTGTTATENTGTTATENTGTTDTTGTGTAATLTATVTETSTKPVIRTKETSTSVPKKIEDAKKKSVTKSNHTTSSKRRLRELLRAREELLRKEVELAAARVAILEEESDEENTTIVSERNERVRTWVEVHHQPLAIAMEPHDQSQSQAEAIIAAGGGYPPEPPRIRPKTSQPRPPSLREEVNAAREIAASATKGAKETHAREPLPRASEMPPYEQHTGVKERDIQRETIQPPHVHASHPEPRFDAEIPAREEVTQPYTQPQYTSQPYVYGGCAMPPQPGYYYGPPQPGIGYRELAEAFTMAAKSIQPTTVAAPRRIPELPKFSGASREWLPFKTAFEATAVYLTEYENLTRLRDSLQGAAKETAECLFVGNTTADEVVSLLKATYGRPDSLVKTELEKLRNLPRLADTPRDICQFASKVANIVATIKALGKVSYLYNPEVVHAVVDKLPSAMRHRFYEQAAEPQEDEPELITISKFLSRIADGCGSFAPAENAPVSNRREPATRAPGKPQVRSHHIDGQKSSSPQRVSPKCPVCSKEGHLSPDCFTLKNALVPARWELAKKHRLCFRCLRIRKFRHNCKPSKCDVGGCTYLHHPLLHDTSPKLATITHAREPDGVIIASTREKTGTAALLKIVPVRVTGPKGTHDTYALLDDGSICTLIETAVAEKIGATGPEEPFYIEGVAGARVDARRSMRVHFTIAGRDTEDHPVTARTMENLRLSRQAVSREVVRGCRHLEDIEDQLIYENGIPTVLVGQDNWHLLITHAVRRGEKRQPVASFTDLGWVLHGVRDKHAGGPIQRVSHMTISHEEETSMEEMMKEHFALESLGVEPKRSYTEEEHRAILLLENRTRRLTTGGFETGLLWREEKFSPPDNYDSTLRRLELVEKKLDRDENLKKRYESQLEILLENGYAEVAPTSRPEKAWYLPHFAVINPQKPEKLRIVHDAAARTKGTSLNDMLLPGPDLLQSLPGVLMRFRQRPIAVAADIKDMFLRVTVREEDRDMQRFLWRKERRSGEPTEYRMKSVIFGASSSPCTAIFVKNKNAEHFQDTYPEAATAIVRNHYVDDYLMSFDTEEEAVRVSKQVVHVHAQANFFLQRWASNSREVLAELAPGTKKGVVNMAPEKILGMIWDTERDTLSFNMNEKRVPTEIMNGKRTPTKREALRMIMSLYDPLGLATPVTIQAKKIMQEAWRSGIGWDTKLQPTEVEAWNKWTEQAKLLPELMIPRCYENLASAHTIELHTFVDASSSAYAAATYWRATDEEGRVEVTLIASKGRVAQLNKVTSIPRLELQAAVLGCRLAQTAASEHDVKPCRRVFWSDSRTVLSWLRTGPRAYKAFVAHRVAEIMEETKTNEWRWVPTKENVADDATRDTPTNFTSEHRWYRGPDFLYLPEESWPQENREAIKPTGEERVHAVRVADTRLAEALPDLARFSNWMRVIRVTARVLQFIDHTKPKERCAAAHKRTRKAETEDPIWTKTQRKKPAATPTSSERAQLKLTPIEARYLHRARQLWLRSQQEDIFGEELAALKKQKPLPHTSRLSQLSVVLDGEGVIRLRSRIAAATEITAAQKEPAIIDGSHPWTRLYIRWVHTQLHHGGFETTANEVRQHYWVIRLRYAVRAEVKLCQACRIRKATPAQPSTGNHPRSRLAHHQRPFTFTGLDYFGPLTVTVGRGHQKRYGALFTCLTTRAVHLEVAGSLTTDSAVMALRRFISRRGCPTEIWSDHGTNLRGADVELRKAAEEALEEESSVRFIQWRYIPPSAPFMGGAWERLVRSVKTALYTTLHERAPKEEVLTTLLVEAEHTINSRPLTHLSTAAEDDEALTPNHFLLGAPSRVPQPGTFTEEDVAGRKEWRASQRLADMFWARWVREYLPELQTRREPRATKGVIKLNDLVLIADGNLPRNSWPRGVVVATYPGPDGEVRAVDVRTTRGILRRPTKKLAILPTELLVAPAK